MAKTVRELAHLECWVAKQANFTSKALADLLSDEEITRQATLQNWAAIYFLLLLHSHRCEEFAGLCCLNLSSQAEDIHDTIQKMQSLIGDLKRESSDWLGSLFHGWSLSDINQLLRQKSSAMKGKISEKIKASMTYLFPSLMQGKKDSIKLPLNSLVQNSIQRAAEPSEVKESTQPDDINDNSYQQGVHTASRKTQKSTNMPRGKSTERVGEQLPKKMKRFSEEDLINSCHSEQSSAFELLYLRNKSAHKASMSHVKAKGFREDQESISYGKPLAQETLDLNVSKPQGRAWHRSTGMQKLQHFVVFKSCRAGVNTRKNIPGILQCNIVSFKEQRNNSSLNREQLNHYSQIIALRV
ncbi:hypothetical protein DV515_00005304 [Chloebia gouldiae]|uniref:Uncharacterized protein n=1 Tax=Chloebia gouldiae TaxID=44316 RepID=A0A3L8SPS8_CHLGU|nr:hypothetical protein DV515_00005304 [Chloebia gouldiae]